MRGTCRQCGARRIDAQLGLEPTPEAYADALVEVFREVRRVLRDDGVVWLNLGDSYCGGGNYRGTDEATLTDKQRSNRGANGQLAIGRTTAPPALRVTGLKSKDLVGIPWRVAFALQADGWYLRSDVIWAKPNPMPESVTDRPTKAHEYVFLLTKAGQYYYDVDAIREPLVSGLHAPGNRGDDAHATERNKFANGRSGHLLEPDRVWGVEAGANARSVWAITTEASPLNHFAVMPRALARRCILAGTSAWGQCPTCGAPWSRVVARGEPDRAHQIACGAKADGTYAGTSRKDYDGVGVQDPSAVKARILAGMDQKQTVGWEPSCDCPEAEPIPQTVLDPFAGVATTGVVALEEGRSFIGIELSPKYYALGEERLRMVSPLLATSASAAIPSAAQPSLFGDDDANAPGHT